VKLRSFPWTAPKPWEAPARGVCATGPPARGVCATGWKAGWKARCPRWLTYDEWNVGVAALDRPLQTIEELLPLRNIRWLPPQPPLSLLADPFPYRHDGREWLLVERYSHRKRVRGRIARIDPDHPAAIETVIERDRHVSYPFTFAYGADVYCAPEMSQEDGCVIYRLAPDGRWTATHHVMRGQRLVDPTLFRLNDRWWLFATEPPPSHNDSLHAYYADALEGPWTPHARNPVKRDPSSARPGGRPFTVARRLYRPAQDCSVTYGGAVHVMEIETLTPTEFRESIALRLEPDPDWPYPDGLHHLVVDGARVYFDAKRSHVDWLLWLKVWL